jgi:AraC-like DNA-binding protein
VRVTASDPSNGILDFPHALDRFRLRRFAPAADLLPWIEGYWAVAWDLPDGQVHRQTNLSHASINAACEPEGAFLYGVPGRTFERDITGRGYVFGTKFRPGGFFPFHGASLRSLTGRRVALSMVFGGPAREWVRFMRESPSDERRVALTDELWRSLRQQRPGRFGAAPAPVTVLAERLVSDRSILTVAQAAAACGLKMRTLQRLFTREVGIGPKEVIRRFRLQEAAERLLRQPGVSSGDIAVDLGYFDQAHFIRDFKAVVGVPPEVYRRRLAWRQGPAGATPVSRDASGSW